MIYSAESDRTVPGMMSARFRPDGMHPAPGSERCGTHIEASASR